MTEKHQRLSTKAWIRNNQGEVLLLCEPNGKWEMPGGKPDFGEHMEDAIAREINEELGISDVKNNGIIGQFDFIATQPKYNSQYQFVCLVFDIDINGQEINLSEEHIKYDWFSLDKALDLDMKPEYKEFLTKKFS